MANHVAPLGVFWNRTRRSHSMARALWRRGRWYLLPLYGLLLTSDLAREGIRNSGSYRFADHIYRNRPSGRWLVGSGLDAMLLRLPSAEAFRFRYLAAKAELLRLASAPPPGGADILAAPCGLARELFETVDAAGRLPGVAAGRFWGFDLDGGLVEALNRRRPAHAALTFWQGDALDAGAYRRQYDMIISMGFTEFLDDTATEKFYRLVRTALKPNGRFITSGMLPHRFSRYLLEQLAELITRYRSRDELLALARRAGFRELRTRQDPHGLQTMLIATNVL